MTSKTPPAQPITGIRRGVPLYVSLLAADDGRGRQAGRDFLREVGEREAARARKRARKG